MIEEFQMNPLPDVPRIAFEGDRRIAAGDLHEVARAAKEALERSKDASILVFDGATSESIELDLRGTPSAHCSRRTQFVSSS
jgi:hypothetical protein